VQEDADRHRRTRRHRERGGRRDGSGLSLAIVDGVAARMSLDEALEAEALGQGRAFGTADFTEGRPAFLDRRPPSFSGR
jgi:hypothetical protein